MSTQLQAHTQSAIANPAVQAVATALPDCARAYLVGGAVRDLLRTGSLPHDLDFSLISADADALARTLADRLDGHLVPLHPEFGIHRVVLGGGYTIDLAHALDNSLETDLARRDLTVNAMALDIQTGDWHDPFNGQKDLAEGVIRMVSVANLLDDPLRLLRVFRIAAGIQAKTIDPATLDVVRNHREKIWIAAGERIQYELLRLLDVTPCFNYLDAMAETGLLEEILPDLTPMRAIGASGFHHMGLFDHSMELVKQAERLLPVIPAESLAWVKSPFNQTISRLALLKLACLLHDIGKPDTMGEREDPVYGKRLTFYRHEEVGEEMAGPLLKRLKFGNEALGYVKKLIRWHLYPCQFGPDSPRKSILRFYRRMGDETPDIVLLALADRHSSRGPWLSENDFQASHEAHIWLLANFSKEESVLKAPRLLSGKDIMQILELSPGPHIGEIIEALQEAQQLGIVKDPQEAKQWLISNHPGT